MDMGVPNIPSLHAQPWGSCLNPMEPIALPKEGETWGVGTTWVMPPWILLGVMENKRGVQGTAVPPNEVAMSQWPNPACGTPISAHPLLPTSK